MSDELISPGGKKLSKVGTWRTTPTESNNVKEIRLTNKREQRRQENQKYLETKNVRAFLVMIGKSEGGNYHAKYGWSPGRSEWMFTDETTHPGFGYRNKSSASGLYQINRACWTEHGIKAQGLTDFSPNTQDLIAVEAIRYRNAIDDVKDGKIKSAVTKLKDREWVSFQVHSLETLIAWYRDADGEIHE